MSLRYSYLNPKTLCSLQYLQFVKSTFSSQLKLLFIIKKSIVGHAQLIILIYILAFFTHTHTLEQTVNSRKFLIIFAANLTILIRPPCQAITYVEKFYSSV